METIKRITKEEAAKIIEDRKPKGKFLLIEKDYITAIDNSTGQAWTEDYKNIYPALAWLDETIDTEESYEIDRKMQDAKIKETKKFYITYGVSDENQPYMGGYTLVHAKNRGEAVRKHQKMYGFTRDGFGRYCSCYTEEEFKRDYPDGLNCGLGIRSELL